MNTNTYKNAGYFLATRDWGLSSLEASRFRSLFLRKQNGRSMKLTTHLYTVPTSRELWTIPPLPQCTLLLLCLHITTIFFYVYFYNVVWHLCPSYLYHSLGCFRFGGYLQFYWSHRQRNWQDPVSSSHTSSTQSCVITACNSSSHYYLNSSHDGTVSVTSSQPGLYTAAHI